MAKIGEYRLKAYELLYTKPLCEYADSSSGKTIFDVLILGNGWMGNELFKAVFWAGQSANSELRVTVASRNARDYRTLLLSEEPGAPLPALNTYIFQKHYANLRFLDINIEDGLDETELAALDFRNHRYNYIVISLGDQEHNWLAASELISQIDPPCKTEAAASGKILMSVFDEFSSSLEKEDLKTLIQSGVQKGIEIHFFGGDPGSLYGDLDRIARNINFAYAMKYDQRASRRKADEDFEKSRVDEFVNSPMDYKVGSLDVISNFTGANYSADSSFAAAVHIPMKLAICKEAAPDRDPLDTLQDAIRNKNLLYKKIVAAEHRRWNAYTIMRGFRAPSAKEEEKILYHNGNTHQDKKRLLHICLCECSTKSSLEDGFDRIYRKWLDKGCPKNYPSELDRASLRIHQITGKIASRIDIDKVVNNIHGDCAPYSNLRHSIRKLANDEDHALVLYRRSLETAKKYAASVSETDMKMIESADASLMPLKVYCERTDFFGLDRQLVDLLPFVLWFGSKYRTVITVTDGSVSATSDVIVPTLFCAENAIYIGNNVGNAQYRSAVSSYFEGRGANTIPRFRELPEMDLDSVCECLEEQLKKYGVDDVLLNCVPTRGFNAPLAIGKLMEKYRGRINVVQYLPDRGIVSYSEDKNIGTGIDNKSFSLSEFIRLMGGIVTNEYAALYDSSRYENLIRLFRTYYKSSKIQNTAGDTKNFNTWISMTKLMSTVAKDYVFEKHYKMDPTDVFLTCKMRFSEDIFSLKRIDQILKYFNDCRIIQNYTARHERGSVFVKFEHVNPELAELLHGFEEDSFLPENSWKSLKFLPMNGGLKIADRRVRSAKIFDPLDPEEVIDQKIRFMKDLSRCGYIHDLTLSENGEMSFVFRDDPTMALLKSQGMIFELIVYHYMCESGLFDDVETGVKIAWNADEELPDQFLIRELQAEETDSIGYNYYKEKRQSALPRFSAQNEQVTNEIDVIGIKGMSGVMVSCKTSENDTIQWIYEIKSLSEHFQARAVMAISMDYSSEKRTPFKNRAKQMNVPVWGTETLWNPEKMKEALMNVVKTMR